MAYMRHQVHQVYILVTDYKKGDAKREMSAYKYIEDLNVLIGFL